MHDTVETIDNEIQQIISADLTDIFNSVRNGKLYKIAWQVICSF